MSLSRQDAPRNSGGRSNQKTRTRAALLHAAGELIREGRAASIPEAAERALVSVATAYRYFPSADDLWWEASTVNVEFNRPVVEAETRIDAAGQDPQARLDALIRTLGYWMLEDQLPSRQIAKYALEQWLRQAADPSAERVPSRQGRRNEHISKVLAPLRGQLPKKDLDRIAHALGLVVGTEAMIALTDAVGLDTPTAKQALSDAARWMLTGALTELTENQ
jgi:AcrR family transcriptional regulator